MSEQAINLPEWRDFWAQPRRSGTPLAAVVLHLIETVQAAHEYRQAVAIAGSYPGHEEYVESERLEIDLQLDDAQFRYDQAEDLFDFAPAVQPTEKRP